jgi:beta-lactamase class A
MMSAQLLLALSLVGLQPAPWSEALSNHIDEVAGAHAGKVALYVEDTRRRLQFEHQADRPMYLASSVKLLVMVEAFRQREEGTLSFEEALPYGPQDVRDGAPAMNRQRVGSRHPVKDLVTYMIRDSDNAATDLLIERIGIERIGRGLEEDGIVGVGPLVNMIHVRRATYRHLDPRADQLTAEQVRDVRWRDHKRPRLDLLKKHIGPPYGTYDRGDLEAAYDAYYATGANHASMRAMGAVLARLGAQRDAPPSAQVGPGPLVSPRASAEMLELLQRVWTSGNRMEGAVPKGTRIAHKTGTQHRRIVDAALVYLRDGTPLVVCIAIQDMRQTEAEALLRALAGRAFELASRHALARGR